VVPEMPSPDRGDDGERRGRSYGQTSSVQERSTDYSYWRERERDGGARPERELGDGWTAALSASAHHPQSKDQAWWPFCPVLSLSVVFTGGSLVFSPVQGYTSLGRTAEGRTSCWAVSARRWMGLDWSGYPFHFGLV